MSNLIPIDVANLAVENLNKEIAQLKADINYLTIENNSNHARWIQALEDLEKYRWQPIETAPKDGTRILGFLDFEQECSVVEWSTYIQKNGMKLSYWEKVDSESETTVTHWMPLPKLPKNNGLNS